jgi:hypothetical protein
MRGLDVAKVEVVACVRTPGKQGGRRQRLVSQLQALGFRVTLDPIAA